MSSPMTIQALLIAGELMEVHARSTTNDWMPRQGDFERNQAGSKYFMFLLESSTANDLMKDGCFVSDLP